MARIKVGVTAHRRHKHILKLAKGYRGAKHLLFRKANETVMKALMYARRDRRATRPARRSHDGDARRSAPQCGGDRSETDGTTLGRDRGQPTLRHRSASSRGSP